MDDMPPWLQNIGIAGVFGGLGWLAQYRLTLRQERRADGDVVTKGTTALLANLQSELDRASKRIGRFEGELELLRNARYALEDAFNELRDQALAARTMVHEMERRLGLPESQFQPLPRPGLPARGPPPG